MLSLTKRQAEAMQKMAAWSRGEAPAPPEPRKMAPRGRPEDDLQEAMIAEGIRRGFLVAVHSARWAACADCGSHRRRSTGATAGHGDLSLARDWWHRRLARSLGRTGAATPGLWFNCDVKPGRSGRLSPAQKAAVAQCGLRIVRSMDEFCAFCDDCDRSVALLLGIPPHEATILDAGCRGGRGVLPGNPVTRR